MMMALISFKSKDDRKTDEFLAAADIFNDLSHCKNDLRFLGKVVEKVTDIRDTVSYTGKSELDILVDAQKIINPRGSVKFDIFKSKYKDLFSRYTFKSHGKEFKSPINKVRGTILELIVEVCAKADYSNEQHWDIGCQIFIGQIQVTLKEIDIDDAPTTVDFAGYQNKFFEGLECKCSPNAFIRKPEHVDFLYFLSSELNRYNVNRKISCVSLTGKRQLYRELNNEFSQTYEDFDEMISVLGPGDLFKRSNLEEYEHLQFI